MKTIADVGEVFRRLAVSDTVVIDVETNGLDWRVNHIVGYVLTFGDRDEDSYYMPVRHESGPNLDANMVKAMIVQSQDRPRLWIGHNISFDLSMLHREGIVLEGTFEDTMLNAALLDEFQRSFSLEACAETNGVQAKKGSEMYEHLAGMFGGLPGKNQMANFWRTAADDPVAIDYATGDGVSTWQLWERQQIYLNGQDLWQVHRVECDLIPVLSRMTMRGIRVHEDRLYKLHDVMVKRQKTAQEAIGELNVNSGPQLKKFFEKHNLTDWPTTEKGNPSFTEEWLRTNEPGKQILAVRKVKYMLESFIDPMMSRHLFRGRVHSQFNQLKSDEFGTVTGRLSSSNPNLQQVPKRVVNMGVPFRSIFLPDEGMVWGSADYSQCEPRLLAYYSRCKVLLDGYTQTPSVDAHTAVAKAANIDRQSGKRLNQALLTGAGTKKAASMLGLPMKEALAIVDEYFKAMPEIKDLQRHASSVMVKRGFVKSILGRRARLEAYGKEYKAVNRLLQCSNADMIKRAMVQIDALYRSSGDGSHLLNNVHDALDSQFLPGKEEVYREGLRIMCDVPEIDIPIEVDEDMGDDWAIASYGSETYGKVMKETGLE